MSGKVGRNDPCPCGSGEKYKKCCLGKSEEEIRQKRNRIESAKHLMMENLAKQRERREKLGDVRPMFFEEYQGEKFVAVGDTLYSSPFWLGNYDFLLSFLVDTLRETLNEPLPDDHPLSIWFDGMCQFHKSKNPCMTRVQAQPNGLMRSFLLLANDLYTIQNNYSYQKSIVKRLAPKDQFHGARYELFAAATCIRAGFQIEYEDESDTSRSHPEFIAIHKNTGQRVAVEAKTRDRPGVYHFPGAKEIPEEINIGVDRVLKKALEKEVNDPFVIFIDMNLPVGMAVNMNTEVERQIDKTIFEHNKPLYLPDPYNLIVLTDHPYHYDESNDPAPKGGFFYTLSKNPMIKVQHTESLIAIIRAAEQFWNVPDKFDEAQ